MSQEVLPIRKCNGLDERGTSEGMRVRVGMYYEGGLHMNWTWDGKKIAASRRTPKFLS